MILELKRQGLGVSAIARQTGLDRKTVRKYLAQGLEVARAKWGNGWPNGCAPILQTAFRPFRVSRRAGCIVRFGRWGMKGLIPR